MKPRRTEPAPALSRGLRLMGILSRDGQATLEQLSRLGGWPKSSTLRYLQALAGEGVVRQDKATKTWHLLKVLRPLPPGEGAALGAARRQLAKLAEQTGQCVELYRVAGGTLELMDRADPEDSEVQVVARIGFIRDLKELDATAQVYRALGNGEKRSGGQWQWRSGEKAPVPAREADRIMEETRRRGYGEDRDFNSNGIRRYAIPVREENELVGILAVAQRQTPRAETEVPVILQTLLTFPSCTQPR